MTERTQDYLSECNDPSLGPPLTEEEFKLAFCDRCVNAECKRAIRGDPYQARTSTWEKRLFLEVPRLKPTDPRYEGIRHQRFEKVNPPLGNVTLNPKPPQEAGAPPGRPPLLLANTVYTGPVTLAGATEKAPVWREPLPEATVVQPGAKVRLGKKG